MKTRVSPTFWNALNAGGRNYMRCTYRTYRQIMELDRNQARRTIDEVLWGMILGRNGTMIKPL